METLFADATFWVLLSFLGFVFLAYKMGRASAMGVLDSYIKTVQSTLAEADDLRANAQALHDKYETAQAHAAEHAKKILADAKVEAKAILDHGREETKDRLAARQAQFEGEIQILEEQALKELRAYMVDLIDEQTRAAVIAALSDKSKEALIDRAIATAAHAKQKAA